MVITMEQVNKSIATNTTKVKATTGVDGSIVKGQVLSGSTDTIGKNQNQTAKQNFAQKTNLRNETRVELSVAKTPELFISSGTDWVAFLGFAITALIVLLTTRQTIKNSNKLIKSQEDLSRNGSKENREIVKAEMTARNRQAWINTLRSDLADYIAAISAIWDLYQIKEGRAQVLKDSGTVENNLKERFEWSLAYHRTIQDSERLLAKIKLLLNPTEDESKKLTVILDKVLEAAKSGHPPSEICQEIIKAAQPILKEEWERVKSMR